jgi:hypothetical protein
MDGMISQFEVKRQKDGRQKNKRGNLVPLHPESATTG